MVENREWKITLNETRKQRKGGMGERAKKKKEGGFGYLYVWGYKETCLSS